MVCSPYHPPRSPPEVSAAPPFLLGASRTPPPSFSNIRMSNAPFMNALPRSFTPPGGSVSGMIRIDDEIVNYLLTPAEFIRVYFFLLLT